MSGIRGGAYSPWTCEKLFSISFKTSTKITGVEICTFTSKTVLVTSSISKRDQGQ